MPGQSPPVIYMSEYTPWVHLQTGYTSAIENDAQLNNLQAKEKFPFSQVISYTIWQRQSLGTSRDLLTDILTLPKVFVKTYMHGYTFFVCS